MRQLSTVPSPAIPAANTAPVIVVGVDDTPTARRAAEAAARLARATGAQLRIVSALRSDEAGEIRGPGTDTWRYSTLDERRDLLEGLAARWPDVASTVTCVAGRPAPVLVAEATRLGADVIVVGNRRMHGASRVLGAVANDVAHHAGCDVYIVNTSEG